MKTPIKYEDKFANQFADYDDPTQAIEAARRYVDMFNDSIGQIRQFRAIISSNNTVRGLMEALVDSAPEEDHLGLAAISKKVFKGANTAMTVSHDGGMVDYSVHRRDNLGQRRVRRL
jgi:hypothetical protein